MSGLITEADWERWTARDLEPYLDVAFDCFGPCRLVAGSDWPVCTLAGDYSRTMAVLRDYLARSHAGGASRGARRKCAAGMEAGAFRRGEIRVASGFSRKAA